MDNYDSYDPYVNYYQTPKKPTTAESTDKNMSYKQKQVFNPYQKEEILQSSQPNNQEELPDYVDLTKNAYSGKIKRDNLDDDDDLPILDELGISPENIKKKLISVLTFHKIDKQILEDADMAGPFFVIVLFGISLVLVLYYFNSYYSKRNHISNIYMDYLYSDQE